MKEQNRDELEERVMQGVAMQSQSQSQSQSQLQPQPQEQRETDMYVGFDHLKAGIENPDPQKDSPSMELSLGNSALSGALGDLYVIVMVGLPATGKTYLGRRISQYLTFFHASKVEWFNVGNYRRKLFGEKMDHEFFDPNITENVEKRKKCAHLAMDDLKKWLAQSNTSSRVAIYDATNSTRQRRRWIMTQLEGHLETKSKVIFVESVINDPKLIEANIKETWLMPDYHGVANGEDDYRKRIEHYRKSYETLSETDPSDGKLSWIKLVDGGRFISMNQIHGFMASKVVQLLTNLNPGVVRPIYLSRHGQSEYNKLGKIGGDSALSESGEEYALALAKHVHEEILGLNEDGTFPSSNRRLVSHARLFTSSLKRTKLTARHIVHHKCDDGWIIMRPKVCPALDEIYAGAFDGMTYEEIKDKAPREFKRRKLDKLGYVYPGGGESYLDVIQRLEPIVHEIERQSDPILIVGHQGVLRLLYAYFTGESREKAPHFPIPLNTIIKLVPRTYECEITKTTLLEDKDGDHDPPSH